MKTSKKLSVKKTTISNFNNTNNTWGTTGSISSLI